MTNHKPRRLVIEISEEAFQYLEILAVGLSREDWEQNKEHYKKEGKTISDIMEPLTDKKNDDFSPGVRALSSQLLTRISEGVRRPGSWERECTGSLTGWSGTVVPGAFGDLVDDEYLLEE